MRDRERVEGGKRGERAAPCGLCIDAGHIGALVFHINNNKNKKTEQSKSYVNGSVRKCECVCVSRRRHHTGEWDLCATLKCVHCVSATLRKITSTKAEVECARL